MDVEEENKRVSMQVTSLSTKLMESMALQSDLEQKYSQTKAELTHLRSLLMDKENIEKRNKILMSENKELMTRVSGLGETLATEIKQKQEAKTNVTNLEKEVEELTATLFEEANVMVSDARKETEATKERNASLVKQLKDKDEFVNDLQNQLKVLKDVLHERDRDLDDSSSRRSSMIVTSSSSDVPPQQKQIIYSPTIDSIRYDLKLFSEFRKFIKTIKDYDTIRDTETKFIKKLLTDDVEPALRLDAAPGISYFNRRTTISSIIDGRVSIEPVSGINETYRLNFQNDKLQETDVKSNLYTYPPHSPPVAMEQACSLCGENRDDILEHSRLYIMKVYGKQDSSNNVAAGAASPVVAHQYPLCSYCLFRLRSVCELFAFLRSLKTDAWKLSKDEIMVKKAWIEFARLRAKLFWAKIGVWDVDNNIVTTKVSASTDDAVYKAISGTADPSRLATYSSTESLLEPKLPETPSNGYKSSPLINQVPYSPQSINKSPRTPVRIIHDTENDTSSIPSEASVEQIASEPVVEALSAPSSGEPLTEASEAVEKEDGSDDDVGDIIGDYSHDEGEDEENIEHIAEAAISSKMNGLQIQTQLDDDEFRPQDSLLDSEQSTPVINKNTSSVLNTPVADSGFDFEKETTPTKLSSKDVVTLDPKLSRESIATTDDETEFVDA